MPRNFFNRLHRKFQTLKYQWDSRDFPPELDVVIETETHGNVLYGSWTICPSKLTKNSIAYTVGVGEDMSFDLSIAEKYRLQVYAIDPTPKTIKWIENQKLPANVNFLPVGLAHVDGIMQFFPPSNPNHVSHTILNRDEKSEKPIDLPVKRLATIAHSLKHVHIDILKLDIEGSEYDVIEDLLHTPELKIDQILIEFHHRFENSGKSKTAKAIRKLRRAGYCLFYISKNREEFSFIQKSCLL